jgi:hypothetical protein
MNTDFCFDGFRQKRVEEDYANKDEYERFGTFDLPVSIP